MRRVYNDNVRNIKLTLARDDCFIRIRTYDRTHGPSHCFIIHKDKVASVLDGQSVVDSDCGSFAEMFERDGQVTLMLWWLSVSVNGNVTGYKQMLSIPLRLLSQILTASDGTAIKYLYRYIRRRKATIHSGKANKILKRIQVDKHLLRAFSKAVRDHFDWADDVVDLYCDGQEDFFFTTSSGFPACGGLILHRSTVNTRAGQKPKVYYGVHT